MKQKQLKIALFQPEIPHNAGAAIRLCAGMDAELHLVRPLGFSINDKHLERVALGYHGLLRPILHNNITEFLHSLAEDEQLFLFSSKAENLLGEMKAGERVVLLFGSETSGILELTGLERACLEQRAQIIKIPQASNFRCHNLSNSIAIGAYEVMRQWNFADLY